MYNVLFSMYLAIYQCHLVPEERSEISEICTTFISLLSVTGLKYFTRSAALIIVQDTKIGGQVGCSSADVLNMGQILRSLLRF